MNNRCFIKVKFIDADGTSLAFGEYPFKLASDQVYDFATPLKQSTLDFTGADGGVILSQFRSQMTFSVKLLLGGWSHDSYWVARQALLKFFSTNEDGTPKQYKAVFIEPRSDQMFMVKDVFLDGQLPQIPTLYAGHYDDAATINFKTYKPLLFSYNEDENGNELQSGSVTLPLLSAAEGGKVWDELGSVWDELGTVWEGGSSGVQTVIIDSSRIIYPVWRLVGLSINPILVNNTTGTLAKYVGTVSHEQTLIVDFATGTARLDGVDVTNNLQGQVSCLPGENLVGFNQDSGSAVSSVIEWVDIL